MSDDESPKSSEWPSWRNRRRESNDWPSWLDRRRYQVGLFVFLAFFVLYGLLVYVSGTRPLTPLEQTSMALIGVVISAVFGVVLGVPLAKRRVKIATQLRRAYGICQTLRNVQRDVDDAIGRMAQRDGIKDPGIIGEFWEEIAGNIRTGLREPISEAERMLEDWGDMDSEERRRIQTEERRKTEEIRELTKRIETAKSVEKDLEGVGHVATSLAAAVQMDERRVRELEEGRPTRTVGFVAGSAKAKVDLGQYEEAVATYDAIIRDYPNVHTNYIGRAKAKYLAGDLAGALVDLKTARKIFSDDPVIDRLEEQITGGKAVTTPLDSTAFNETIEGNKALASGHAMSAARHYKRAAELGWNPFFVKFNIAMVRCLEKDFQAARLILNDLTAEADSYMSINKYALLAVCEVLEHERADREVEHLRRLISELGFLSFDYARSPLRHLEAGFKTVDRNYSERLAPVFTVLRDSTEQVDSLVPDSIGVQVGSS